VRGTAFSRSPPQLGGRLSPSVRLLVLGIRAGWPWKEVLVSGTVGGVQGSTERASDGAWNGGSAA